MRTILFLLVCTIGLQATAQTLHRIDSLRLIGIKTYDDNYTFDSTIVGGLSGIDRAPDGTYYIISDDKSEFGSSRVYTAHLYYGAHSFDSLVLNKVIYLKNQQQEKYPFATCDPESVRFDPNDLTLIWSSEGIYKKHIQPALTRAGIDGSYLKPFPMPAQFCYGKDTTYGLRDNAAIEGISFSTDHKYVWYMNESPLYEDGPVAQPYATRSPLRLTLAANKDGKVKHQYSYMLDPLPAAAGSMKGFYINGVSEILAIDKDKVLVLERAYSKATGNTIKLFEADIDGATDIQHTAKLAGAQYTPVKKRLVCDLGFTVPRIDNIEGMTFGKELPNGHQVLVFISDNNFSDTQQTQVIVYEVEGK